MSDLPNHYLHAIRRLLRFAAVGITVGLLLGITWTEFNKSTRYGPEVRKVDPPEGRVKLELPPGTRWANGLHFKLGHGHSILILGLLPIGFATTLLLLHRTGGAELSPRTVGIAPAIYLAGGVGAVAIMVYKGGAVFLGLRRAVLAGEAADLAQLEAGLFLGSRAIKAVAYGTTHSAMAVGAFWFMIAVYRAAGSIGRESPAAPSAAPSS